MSKRSGLRARIQDTPLLKARPNRVCADCGYKDYSPVPPVMCPKCHNQPDSALVPKAAKMNRKERRARDAQNRLQQRRVNKQIARESGGNYEAS